jgi:hypothetical protein
VPFDGRPLASASLDSLALDVFRIEVLPQLVAAEALADDHRTGDPLSRNT